MSKSSLASFLAANLRKPTRSGGNSDMCVEVALDSECNCMYIGDTKNEDYTRVLRVPAGQYAAFMDARVRGSYQLAA